MSTTAKSRKLKFLTHRDLPSQISLFEVLKGEQATPLPGITQIPP